MKWWIKIPWCLKNLKNHYENGKVGCFSPKIFDWSRMFWLVKQSKSFNGQWPVNQLLILHPRSGWQFSFSKTVLFFFLVSDVLVASSVSSEVGNISSISQNEINRPVRCQQTGGGGAKSCKIFYSSSFSYLSSLTSPSQCSSHQADW